MNENNEWEVRLRTAKPMDNEIAPLSPEASARILSAALRANRQRRPAPFWLAAPLRVAVSSMAVAVVTYCVIPYISTTDVPISGMPITDSAIPAAPAATPVVFKGEGGAPVVGGVKRPATKGSPLPQLPSTSPVTVKPQVMIAKKGGGASYRRRAARAAETPSAITSEPAAGTPPPRKAATAAAPDEGDMYVSVTGDSVLPPEGETDDGLTVQVARDVPATVTGRAEAAALHTVPVDESSAAASPDETASVPVWTHVRVETGEEAVLTLTAIP